MLLTLGHLWLALASLWLSSSLSYFALIKTTLLMGPRKIEKPKRRISLLFIAALVIVLALGVVFTLLLDRRQEALQTSEISLETMIRTLMASEKSLVTLTICMLALVALLTVQLLVRRDDVIDKQHER
jgi:hypothetical protein